MAPAARKKKENFPQKKVGFPYNNTSGPFQETPPMLYGQASRALGLSAGYVAHPEGCIPGLWAKRAPMPRASSPVYPKGP